jgi:hypothetical protein
LADGDNPSLKAHRKQQQKRAGQNPFEELGHYAHVSLPVLEVFG